MRSAQSVLLVLLAGLVFAPLSQGGAAADSPCDFSLAIDRAVSLTPNEAMGNLGHMIKLKGRERLVVVGIRGKSSNACRIVLTPNAFLAEHSASRDASGSRIETSNTITYSSK